MNQRIRNKLHGFISYFVTVCLGPYSWFTANFIFTPLLGPGLPIITNPPQDVSITLTSLISFESFSLTHHCISTGLPTPTITWTSNNNLVLNVISDTLTVHSQDLQPELSINIFTCTANNSVGLDSKSIKVVFDIEQQLKAPKPPIQENISTNNVEIHWVEYISSIDIFNYELCVQPTTESECIQNISTISTEYSIGNLESNTTYSITIVAITVFGRSPASKPLIVKTDNPGTSNIHTFNLEVPNYGATLHLFEYSIVLVATLAIAPRLGRHFVSAIHRCPPRTMFSITIHKLSTFKTLNSERNSWNNLHTYGNLIMTS